MCNALHEGVTKNETSKCAAYGLGKWNLSYILSIGPANRLYSQCHTKRRIDGAPPSNPSFGRTTAKIFKDAFLRHVTCIGNPLEVIQRFCTLFNQTTPAIQTTTNIHKKFAIELV